MVELRAGQNSEHGRIKCKAELGALLLSLKAVADLLGICVQFMWQKLIKINSNCTLESLNNVATTKQLHKDLLDNFI